MIKYFLFSTYLLSLSSFGTFDQTSERYYNPLDFYKAQELPTQTIPDSFEASKTSVLRVDVNWNASLKKFEFFRATREQSGTKAFYKRAKNKPKLGSFIGKLVDKDNQLVGWDSVGTGYRFKYMSRGVSLRFPDTGLKDYKFELWGEDDVSGALKSVVSIDVKAQEIQDLVKRADVEILTLKNSSENSKIRFNIYAEGYLSGESDAFFRDAARLKRAILDYKNLPEKNFIEIVAVFAPSNKRLGKAVKKDEGFIQDSFLSLYFPYWRLEGRWYHVLYPTSISRYRDAIGQVPYDYPIALVKDSNYWGVGNYNELTAVPSDSGSMVGLFHHEFGHFIGLNEEYSSGGPTELEFSSGVLEPFSQNLTFTQGLKNLKWKSFLNVETPVPTPYRYNRRNQNLIGAFSGGYAGTGTKKTYIPARSCVMKSLDANFCDVCKHAIEHKFHVDMGTRKP